MRPSCRPGNWGYFHNPEFTVPKWWTLRMRASPPPRLCLLTLLTAPPTLLTPSLPPARPPAAPAAFNPVISQRPSPPRPPSPLTPPHPARPLRALVSPSLTHSPSLQSRFLISMDSARSLLPPPLRRRLTFVFPFVFHGIFLPSDRGSTPCLFLLW